MGAGAVLSVALLLPAAVPPDLPEEEVAARAEAEFAAGVRLRDRADQARPHFRAAAEHFEALRVRGVSNPLLYANLGNAYLLADDLPRAVLTYHRGLRLAPGDRALRAGLERARGEVVYADGFGRPAPDARPAWLPRVGPGWLLGGAVALYGLGCAGLTRWLMVRRGRALVAGVAALLGAGGLTAALAVAGRSEQGQLVIVARDGVLLRRGDGEAFPSRYEAPLNRGAEARLLFERDGWLQVELAGGQVGWVARADVLMDEGAGPG